jgi:hypothetical protein
MFDFSRKRPKNLDIEVKNAQILTFANIVAAIFPTVWWSGDFYAIFDFKKMRKILTKFYFCKLDFTTHKTFGIVDDAGRAELFLSIFSICSVFFSNSFLSLLIKRYPYA